MLVAFLPSVLYIDHWTDYAVRLLGQPDVLAAIEREGSGHESHCHVGPSTCSEQPAPNVGQVFPAVVQLDYPELPAVLLEDAESPLEEHTRSPLTEPPRA